MISFLLWCFTTLTQTQPTDLCWSKPNTPTRRVWLRSTKIHRLCLGQRCKSTFIRLQKLDLCPPPLSSLLPPLSSLLSLLPSIPWPLFTYVTDPTHLTHFLRGRAIYLDFSLESLIPSQSTTICSSFAAPGSGAKTLVCIGGDVNVRSWTTTAAVLSSANCRLNHHEIPLLW